MAPQPRLTCELQQQLRHRPRCGPKAQRIGSSKGLSRQEAR
jgi:hypothetical protein